MSNSQHPQNTLHSRSLKLYSKQPIQSIPFLNNAKRHPIESIYCQPVQQVAITFFPLHRLISARRNKRKREAKYWHVKTAPVIMGTREVKVNKNEQLDSLKSEHAKGGWIGRVGELGSLFLEERRPVGVERSWPRTSKKSDTRVHDVVRYPQLGCNYQRCVLHVVL